MPWVPLQESIWPYDFLADGDAVLDNSIISLPFGYVGSPSFGVFGTEISDLRNIRITNYSYETAGTGDREGQEYVPSFLSWNGNMGYTVQSNSAAPAPASAMPDENPVDGWNPDIIETGDGCSGFAFSPGRVGEILDGGTLDVSSYEWFIEVFDPEDPDPEIGNTSTNGSPANYVAGVPWSPNIVQAPPGGFTGYVLVDASGNWDLVSLGGGLYVIQWVGVGEPSGPSVYGLQYYATWGESQTDPAALDINVSGTPEEVSYNCNCDEGLDDYDSEPKKTLAELRLDLLALLGFAAQANNPPPGVAFLCNTWLNQAQKFLYEKYEQFRGERYFQWDLVEGVRFYDFIENRDVCTKKINARNVSWVGIKMGSQDPGQQWQPLVEGIHPMNYSGGIPSARPYLYEFRQCIEVFPAPTSEPGQLVIKGQFGLLRFTDDDDRATIDDTLVLFMAAYLGKRHYNKPDATDYQGMVQSRMGDLNAGNFHTGRHIPGATYRRVEPLPVMRDGYEE